MMNPILSKNEEKVLEYLKKTGRADIEEISKDIGINIDGVKRSIFFLSKKGLVDMKIKKGIKMELSDKGKDAIKNGFVEEDIYKYNGKSVGELPLEIKKMLWLLRETGVVSIENGVIKTEKKKYVLRDVLENIEKYSTKQEEYKRYFDILKKEGYVKERKIEHITGEITEKGRSYEIKEGGEIRELTREIIINKDWKKRNFKEFNLTDNLDMEESGKLHPLTIAIRKIKDVFISLGFKEMEGSYVESSFWVFDALFQPQDHPSRELADTFYIKGKADEKLDEKLLNMVKKTHEDKWRYVWKFEEARRLVLRTHTTALSSRQLFKSKSGKFFAIGKVFRNEAVDYKHLAEFHQIEGIVAWKNANFRNLLWLLKEFYSRLGFKKIRFRPSYFPYTEPSLEVETYFEKRGEWVEIAGAGIFRKEVVEPLGAEYPVLAWGLSLERPLMLMLGVEDIRTFYTNKKSWLDRVSYKNIF